MPSSAPFARIARCSERAGGWREQGGGSLRGARSLTLYGARRAHFSVLLFTPPLPSCRVPSQNVEELAVGGFRSYLVASPQTWVAVEQTRFDAGSASYSGTFKGTQNVKTLPTNPNDLSDAEEKVAMTLHFSATSGFEANFSINHAHSDAGRNFFFAGAIPFTDYRAPQDTAWGKRVRLPLASLSLHAVLSLPAQAVLH